MCQVPCAVAPYRSHFNSIEFVRHMYQAGGREAQLSALGQSQGVRSGRVDAIQTRLGRVSAADALAVGDEGTDGRGGKGGDEQDEWKLL